MSDGAHWDQVYGSKDATTVSWFQGRAALSLQLIEQSAASLAAPIIDVGGGASTLVDDLLVNGHGSLSVLDISAAALRIARARLGDSARQVQWLAGDITTISLPANGYDIWHDRAVFHFLTSRTQRQAYVHQARKALRPGGHLIISTFSDRGPTRCSELPVVPYSPQALSAEFADHFTRRKTEYEQHATPSGSVQEFVYCVFQLNDRA